MVVHISPRDDSPASKNRPATPPYATRYWTPPHHYATIFRTPPHHYATRFWAAPYASIPEASSTAVLKGNEALGPALRCGCLKGRPLLVDELKSVSIHQYLLLMVVHYLKSVSVFSVKMSASRAPRSSDGDNLWRQNERLIRGLYQDERKTLKEVKHTMETVHGFPKRP